MRLKQQINRQAGNRHRHGVDSSLFETNRHHRRSVQLRTGGRLLVSFSENVAIFLGLKVDLHVGYDNNFSVSEVTTVYGALEIY